MKREIIRVEPFDSNFEKWVRGLDLHSRRRHGLHLGSAAI